MAAGAWDEVRPPELDLIRDCVHCGFCLTTCPSYAVFEEEMDSPRGRILLMRVGHEPGEEISPEMTTHFDNCLGCMACVTACPSGVQYDRLIERVRPQVERHGDRTWRERLLRGAIFSLFTHPARLRVMVPGMVLQQRLRLAERFGDRLPFLRLAPRVTARAAIRRLPEIVPAVGEKRGTVAFMQGCVQRVFFGDVNAATVRVLAAEGFEVHSPLQPRC
jgi:glycolate oxidase iron-sulfur subunit